MGQEPKKPITWTSSDYVEMRSNDHDWPDPNSWKYHLRVAAYRWVSRLIHRYPAKLDEDQDDKDQDNEDQDDNPPATGEE